MAYRSNTTYTTYTHSSAASEKRQSSLIHSPPIIPLQHLPKHTPLRRHRSKQCHRRTQLQMIRIPHDLLHRFPLYPKQSLRTLHQPRPKNRMPQIRLRFLPTLNRILLRQKTPPQTRHLRKHIPNPMRCLPPPPQLSQSPRITPLLGFHKTL